MKQTATPVELDAEERGRTRKLGNSFWGLVIKAAAILLSVFHFYTAGFGNLPMIKQRSFHLALVMFLVFLLFPMSKKMSKKKMFFLDPVIAFLALACNFYVFYRFDIIARNSGILQPMDLVVGGILIILVLEACRRTSGMALPTLMIIALLYCYFGRYFPGFLHHAGLSVRRIIQFMIWSSEGIYGLVLGVSSTYLFLFVLFGCILEKTGLSAVINDLALSVAGGLKGGPAKVSVIASACMGTISGSAVANVATTGALTIPLMKKNGYPSAFAASVEAISSTGGMIMPPIMGATAFIMAEFLGVPYFTIMKAGIIPALLYYFATWMVVDFEARKLKIKSLDKKDLPKLKEVLAKRGYLLFPILLLVVLMAIGKTTAFAAFYSIILALLISTVRLPKKNKEGAAGETAAEGAANDRMTPKKLVETLEVAGTTAIPVACACASVGIMVGMTGATGIGLVLGDGLIKLAGGNFYLTLIFAMVTCLILGMGLPSTACYIVVSTIAAPALTGFQIDLIPIHFFVFYFGILSVLTPPVAMASFTAAGIAGESPSKVGWTAFRFAIAGFLIPYIFITSPELLLVDATIFGVISKFITAAIGCICLAATAVGFLFTDIRKIERVILFLAGVLLMDGGLLTDAAGVAILVVIVLLNRNRAKRADVLSVSE